eukprot:5442945-Karenia_brevis.AAC.1
MTEPNREKTDRFESAVSYKNMMAACLSGHFAKIKVTAQLSPETAPVILDLCPLGAFDLEKFLDQAS